MYSILFTGDKAAQTRVCGAGVVRKSMGTFSCAKDLIVKFNGFRMFFFLALHETIVQLSH